MIIALLGRHFKRSEVEEEVLIWPHFEVSADEAHPPPGFPEYSGNGE